MTTGGGELDGFRERDVAVNGLSLRVAAWGRAAGADRAVLLVHGITANNRAWLHLGPFLAARGWFVVAPDLRGRGKSAKPPHGYGLPFHANDLLALCDELGLTRAHLIGHSLGALVGLYLAAVHPDRLGKLVLVDAGGRLPPDTFEAIAPALARLGDRYPSLDAYLAAMRETTRLPWAPVGEAYYRHDAEVKADGTAGSGVPKAAIAEEQAAIAFSRTDVLPDAVKAPTLIVRATEGLLDGKRGQILPRPEAERLLGAIGDSRLVEIVGADHYTVVLSEKFGRAAAAFLAEGTAEVG